MRARRPVPAVMVLAAGTALLLSACNTKASGATDGAGGSPAPSGTPSATTPAPEARAQLAGLIAAAQDRRMTAAYTLTRSGQPARSVTVTLATDGSWRIDLPGGALGGAADVAVIGAKGSLYQCALSIAGTANHPTCVRVAGLDGPAPAAVDPRVQHFFTDWLDVLADRRAALSVVLAAPLAGSRGTCFSVDSNSASLAPQVDAGIYCYDADGTLTATRTSAGTMLLSGQPGPAPQTVQLPGPVVTGVPLPTASPAAPPTSTATANGAAAPGHAATPGGNQGGRGAPPQGTTPPHPTGSAAAHR